MNSEHKPNADSHDELVAYLDGELSPEECRRIEQQLSSNDLYRQQLQGLDDVWQALDDLPESSVDESFSRTTIEMVTVAAQEDLATKTAALPVQRRNQKLFVGGLVALAALLGFVAARVFWPDPNRDLLAELPIVQQVDVYTEVDDVEFLRRLGTSDATAPLDKSSTDVEFKLSEWREASLETPRQRRDRIERMSDDERAALLTKSNRFFHQIARPEQARIRELHEAILAEDDSRELQKTMLVFGNWVQGRTPGERADLRERGIDERIERIRDLVRRDQWRSLRELSAQDSTAIRKEALAFFEERQRFVEKMFKREGVDDVDQTIKDNRNILAQFVALKAMESDRDRDQSLERFLQPLSEPVRSRLEDMHDEHAARFVRRWIRQAFRGQVRPSDLEHYFANELTNAQREELLAMPADQMDEALYSMYVREKFDLHDLPDDDREPFRRPDSEGRRREGMRPEDRGERPPGPPPGFDGPPPGPREPGGRRERPDPI